MRRAIGAILGIQAASVVFVLASPERAHLVAAVLGILSIGILGHALRTLPRILGKIVDQEVSARTIELRDLMTHYEQQAMTDALTSLLNRRGGEDAIGRHIARCRRLETAFSVILIDIDHFKKINDRYGHSVGDLVISSVAKVIKETVRQSDLAVRWGGEEFLVCLPDTDLCGAITTAEKLRQAIEKTDLDITTTTASFGCAELGEDDFEVALARADMHLYMAKSKGRNRVFPNSLHKELDVP